ncbi:MAG: hypothetical protein ACTSQO_04255 [Candidatus Helarchaeota archaeon]
MGDFGYNTIIWTIAIGTLIILGIFFLLKNKKDKINEQKGMDLGLGFFFIFYAICRISFIISDYAENILLDNILMEYMWRLATLFGLMGLTIMTFVIEFYILEKKTKFIFSIIGVITIIISVVGGSEIGRIAILYGPVAMGFIIIILYSYIAIKSSGYVRKRSLQALIGILLFYSGITIDSNIISGFLNWMFGVETMLIRAIAAVILIIGVVIFGLSYKKTEE